MSPSVAGSQPLWKTVYVFISSTFNDMHAERDFLVKRVFPGLSDWCERRRLRLMDIDLRWGVTELDATRNLNVLNACLNRIDACRPFFLCFLGQRYGWVPSPSDVSPETLADFPGLESAIAGNVSVTELEIRHAVAGPFHPPDSPGARPCEAAFFFRRDPPLEEFPAEPACLRRIYTDEAETDPAKREFLLGRRTRLCEQTIPGAGQTAIRYQARWDGSATTPELEMPLESPSSLAVNAQRWRDQWREFAAIEIPTTADAVLESDRGRAQEFNRRLTGGRLGDFTCDGNPLEERISNGLEQAIAKLHPLHTERPPADSLERELDQNEQFLFACSEEFIPRKDDFAELDAYAAANGPEPFVLTASAGTGKSTLLAAWLNHRRADWAEEGRTVHFRFIGASDGSSTAPALLASLALDLKQAGKHTRPVPADPAELLAIFPAMLADSGKKGPTILVLDGINQIAGGLRSLDWLPRVLPSQVRLIASLRSDAPGAPDLVRLWRESGRMRVGEVMPFRSPDDRRKLVNAYLAQYFKQLDDRQIDTLILSDGAENPLFLKVVLSELRVFGGFSGLSELIRTGFGRTPETAFDHMLERLRTEAAFTAMDAATAAPEMIGLLAYAQNGLSAMELGSLLSAAANPAVTVQEGAETALYYIRQMRPFLARREGRFDFFYESLRIAARARSGKLRPEAEWHRRLAEHFRAAATANGGWNSTARRALAELPYHLLRSGELQQLYLLYTDVAYLDARCRSFREAFESPLAEQPEFLDLLDELLESIPSFLEFDREKGQTIQAIARLLRDRNTMLARFPENIAQEIGNYLDRYSKTGAAEAIGAAARRIPARLAMRSAVFSKAAEGHSARIAALAVSPSGQEFLSGDDNGTVGYWSILEDAPRWVQAAHEDGVTSIAFSPDGRMALTAGMDGAILRWDLEAASRRQFRPLGPHFSHAWVGAFLDAETAVAATAEAIFTFDVSTGQVLWRPSSAGSTVMALAPAGRTIVSAVTGGLGPYAIRLLPVGGSAAVRVTDLDRPAAMVTFTADSQAILAADPQGYIYAFQFDGAPLGKALLNPPLSSWCHMEDGTLLASDETGLYRISFPSLQAVPVPLKSSAVTALAPVSRGRFLAGGCDGSITLANLEKTEAERFWGAAMNFTAGAFLDNGSAVALTGSRSQGERILGRGPYFISAGGEIKPPATSAHGQFITGVMALDKGQVLTVARDGTRFLWNGTKGQELPRADLGLTCGNTWPEGGLAVAGTNKDVVCLMGRGPQVLKFELRQNFDPPGVSAVAAGGKPVQIVAALQNSEVASAGRYQWRIKSASGMGTAAAIDTASGRAATGHGFGKVHLWNAEREEEIWQMPLHAGPVYAMAFGADGLLYTAGADRCVLAIDPGSKKIMAATTLAHSAVALVPFDGGVRVLDSTGSMYAFGVSGSQAVELPAPWPKRLLTIWKRFR